jgi:hypothetical protein
MRKPLLKKCEGMWVCDGPGVISLGVGMTPKDAWNNYLELYARAWFRSLSTEPVPIWWGKV